jgi:hypothetical protein
MVLATRALEARKLKDRVRNLWGALIVSVMLIAGVFCYHEWWDPSRAGPQDNEVMVNGTDVQVFLLYDQPDGSQTHEYQPINSDIANITRMLCILARWPLVPNMATADGYLAILCTRSLESRSRIHLTARFGLDERSKIGKLAESGA